MGMVAKLANNNVSLVTVSLIIEARALAQAYGMDMDKLMEVFKSGTANSFIVQAWDWFAPYEAENYPLMVKDLNTVKAVAASKNIAMPTLDAHIAKDWDVLGPKLGEL